MYKVGIIGFGFRIKNIVDAAQRIDSDFKITAIADPLLEKCTEGCESFNINLTGTKYYADADSMLQNEELDGVMVGTRCSMHTPEAIKVMKIGLPLFLEKPVALTIEQIRLLEDVRRQSNSRVVVSFPLRMSYLAELAKQLVDSGRIGTVEHVQAVNNVPYGSVYFCDWYRDEGQTHGLWFAKTTHDFDYINYVIGRRPVSIAAVESKQVFKGDMPANLKHADCPKYKMCMESPYQANIYEGGIVGDYCAFAEDTGNMDSGSAIITYEDGMHACYSQNFFARNGAALRGARFIGYEGTIDFDFYTGTLKLHRHHAKSSETYQYDSMLPHFSGDRQLCINFMEVMSNSKESRAPLEAGIVSSLISLRARESHRDKSFKKIEALEELI